MKVGDAVKWKSQAQGYATVKEGVIVAVLQPGERPNKSAHPDMFKTDRYGSERGPGFGRKELSYVVKVRNRHYWPRSLLLQPAGATALDHVKAKLASALSSLRSFDPKLADHIEKM
jgi:hypothetical protein